MSTRYTKDHEWIRLDGEVATVGITDHAQSQLGDIVFVELPEIGRKVEKGGDAAVVESVKAASDVYAPLAGTIVAANDTLSGSPEAVNENAYDAWLFKLEPTNAADLEGFMDSAAYSRLIAEA